MAKRKGSAADDIQNHIPDTGPVKIESVHNAAIAMLDSVRKTKKATAFEKSAREDVRAAMEAEGIDEYEYGGLVVRIDHKRTPKVTQAKKQKADAEEE